MHSKPQCYIKPLLSKKALTLLLQYGKARLLYLMLQTSPKESQDRPLKLGVELPGLSPDIRDDNLRRKEPEAGSWWQTPLSGKASPFASWQLEGTMWTACVHTNPEEVLHHHKTFLRLLTFLSSLACVSHDLKLPEGVLSDSEILRQTMKLQLDLLSE